MIRILHIIREYTNYEGIYTFLTKIKEATKDKGIEHYFIVKIYRQVILKMIFMKMNIKPYCLWTTRFMNI